MDLEGIIVSEVSQTEKEKYTIISLICGKTKQTKQSENRCIDTENKQLVARGGRVGGRDRLGVWD